MIGWQASPLPLDVVFMPRTPAFSSQYWRPCVVCWVAGQARLFPCHYKTEAEKAPGPRARVRLMFLPHRGRPLDALASKRWHVGTLNSPYPGKGTCDSLALKTTTPVKHGTAASFPKSLCGPMNGASPCHTGPMAAAWPRVRGISDRCLPVSVTPCRVPTCFRPKGDIPYSLVLLSLQP